MAGKRERDVPAIDQSRGVSIERPNSKLLRRGILSLHEEERICPKVHNLVAFGDSVFVLAEGWDADRSGASGEAPAWHRRRYVHLHEFRWTGEYVGPVMLPLLEFSDEGIGRIERRWPRLPVVRSGVIHFQEMIASSESPRDTLVSYIFSRSGERLAVWANEPWVNQYRNSGEPVIPDMGWLLGDWVTENSTCALFPRHPSLGDPPPKTGDLLEDFRLYAHTAEYLVVFQNVERLVSLVRFLNELTEGGQITPEIGVESHDARVVEFPVETALMRGNVHRPGWHESASDQETMWFLKHVDDSFVIWALSPPDSGAEPTVTAYTLPGPEQLVRDGILKVVDDDGEVWIPVPLESHRSAEAQGSADEDSVWFEQVGMMVSGDQLIVEIEGHGPKLRFFDNAIVVFHREDGALRPLKGIDINGMHLDMLIQRWLELPEDSRDQQFETMVLEPNRSHPSSGMLDHQGFAKGRLFSVNRHHNDQAAIIVTDVDTGTVAWFYPQVPRGVVSANSE